jgi:outer membrane protein assembly factor BamB
MIKSKLLRSFGPPGSLVLGWCGAGLLLSLAASADQLGSDRWPMFRGPNASGHALGTNHLPVEFGPGRNERWHVATPQGHSSPCVWGSLIFLTGADRESKQLETIAVRRSDGHIQWRSSVTAERLERVHRVSNGAPSTAVTDGRVVVVYFGSFGLVAYDFAGKETWRVPLPVFDSMNGSGTSPVLIDGTVYLNREDKVEQVLMAIDAVTGTKKWKLQHPDSGPNELGVASTPVFWNKQLLLHRGYSLSAYDAATGALAWVIPINTTGSSTPVISEGRLVVAAWNNFGESDQFPPWPPFARFLEKYDADKDRMLGKTELPDDLFLTVRPGVEPGLGGNMSVKMMFPVFDANQDQKLDAEEWKAAVTKVAELSKGEKHGVIAVDLTQAEKSSEKAILWRIERNVPEVPSPLVHRGQVYLVRNGGILTCADLDSGQINYQERLGASGPYYASPIEASDHIYICAGNGKVAVLREGKTFQLLAVNDLREGIFATPAAVGDDLLIRTEKQLFSFRR